MDTGVGHGRAPDPDAGGSSGQPATGEPGTTFIAIEAPTGPPLPPQPVYEDVPTTILDLRQAFAEAGPHGAPPLGIVASEQERPVRAGVAFVVVLLVIAGVATGLVMGVAAAGKAVYAKLSGPKDCSAAQVSDGVALESWLTPVSVAAGPGIDIVRTGCVTPGVLDPLTGQSAAITVRAGRPTNAVVTALKRRDCTLGTPSQSGVRTCTVEVGGRLGSVELRPAKDRRTTTFTVAFR